MSTSRGALSDGQSVLAPAAGVLSSPTPPAGIVCSRTEIFQWHCKYENVMVPMRDGAKLAGDLYLPAIDGVPEEGRQFPCVLIRTPYNKGAENPDLRNPGLVWTQNGYCCFIQDCRGRFKSDGSLHDKSDPVVKNSVAFGKLYNFYKYTGEAWDGYDTVEWLAQQAWSNGCICSDGPSYLCHVQTSMALLRPPHLRACFMNKGGFWNSWTSGVRNGGAYEARQWVWAVKNAPRKDPQVKEVLESVDKNFGAWLERYPFKRGDSPLAAAPEYENFIFDQASDMAYGDYWKQIGLNTEEHMDDFADIPCIWMSGWYDIYCRSTVEFFVNLVKKKKGPHLLIMGPWQHVGPEGHVAGDVDFGVNALISGNLAPNVPSLARRWFDNWVTPAVNQPRKLTPEQKLKMVIEQAERQEAATKRNANASGDFLAMPQVRGPYTSLSRIPASLAHSNSMEALSQGPSLYILPSNIPRERAAGESGPLPPPVRYFRMGGGDGHKTSQGCMFHGGVWMAATTWPPIGTKEERWYLGRRSLTRGLYDQPTAASSPAGPEGKEGEIEGSMSSLNIGGDGSSSSNSNLTPASPNYKFTSHMPAPELIRDSKNVSIYDYNPRNPCPSIGGNVFGHRDVLIAGAFNQVERPGMFLCKPPYLPLSSRGDVVVFRSEVLNERVDVTGMPIVKLIISSSAVDTDFTAKLIDEYPPSHDYPAGYAMQVTHGIRRCRFRNSREKAELMVPNTAYEITIELYPTSNLFAKGHRIRLDISSSNFPHFDLNLNTGEDFESQRVVVAQNSVYHHPFYPSRLILPIQTKTEKQVTGPMHEVSH